jgi:hypothetical protein
MVSCYSACPTKFYYEFIEGLSPSGTSPDLHAGAAFARGMEAVRRVYFDPGEHPLSPRPSPTDAICAGLLAFMREWGEYEPPANHPRTFLNTIISFVDYFEVYPLDSDPLRPYFANRGPAVEFTFAISLPIRHPDTGKPILYGGRFGMLACYQNAVFVVDEKTTRALGPSWTSQWKMRGQLIGYTWAARQHHIPAIGAIVRGIGILKTETKHLQVVEQFPDFLINNWYHNLLNKVKSMVQDYRAISSGVRPASTAITRSFGDACSAYGGCPFLSLCTSYDPREWFDNFARRRWNPLNQNPLEIPSP